jgi:hypothetical protein
MNNQNQKKPINPDSRKRLMRALEEYFDTGSCTVPCDNCQSPITFRQLSPSVWEHFCSCGQFDGTMKGL